MSLNKTIFSLAMVLLISCNQETAKNRSELSLGPDKIERAVSGPGSRVAVFQTRQGSLSPQARLRKLSFHIRGSAPLDFEYEALTAALSSGSAENFFASKAKQYLSSSQHLGKMIDRLDEVFRLKTSEGTPEWMYQLPLPAVGSGPVGSYSSSNGVDFFFEEMIRENKSWDTLLSAKSYRIVPDFGPSLPAIVKTDLPGGFYAEMASQMATPIQKGQVFGLKYDEITFSSSDPRVAGVVTTERFFQRYNTTNVNKNRGRAAALFRIFLCDEMRAVVQTSSGDDSELINQAFPPKPKPDAMHSFAFLDDDPHVGDASCAACHYKLDPLGKTFLTSGSVLSSEPSYGALVFKHADNSLVNIPGKGLGDVAAAIVPQPEYVSCQVNRFWKWFVQGDVPPSTARLNELIKVFDQVGRRPNDFIAYLVSQPEFYRDPNLVSQAITLTEVKNTMDRCTNCHVNISTVKIPGFSTFPIGSGTDHQNWMQKIVKRLDLAHDGAKADMPPATSAWQPSNEDLGLLKQWVATGVRDESGNVTVDPTITQQWLKP